MMVFAALAALLIQPGPKQDKAPKPGSDAPNFKLKTLQDPDKTVQLSGFQGKRPVVLIFGSYT